MKYQGQDFVVVYYDQFGGDQVGVGAVGAHVVTWASHATIQALEYDRCISSYWIVPGTGNLDSDD